MTAQLTTTRQERGQAIAKAEKTQITRVDNYKYKVLSQNGHGDYVVCLSEDEWRCECPDHRFRGVNASISGLSNSVSS